MVKDREACGAVHGFSRSQTQLKRLSLHTRLHSRVFPNSLSLWQWCSWLEMPVVLTWVIPPAAALQTSPWPGSKDVAGSGLVGLMTAECTSEQASGNFGKKKIYDSPVLEDLQHTRTTHWGPDRGREGVTTWGLTFIRVPGGVLCVL